MRVPAVTFLLLAAASWAQSQQLPLSWPLRANAASPALHMSTIDTQKSTVLEHPAFPKHRVRVNRVEGFCDATVGVYTGYVDVEAKHFFFWFFESRRNPDKDDVVLWLNGGPGSSATLGMLMELGPCNVAGPNSTAYNPHAWNTQANLIFIDQPVGVGFSYADHGETVHTSADNAVDIAAFFAILSDAFPQFQGRKLHLTGESFAGRYIPLIASAIVDTNPHLENWGMAPVNLGSIALGNALIDLYSWWTSFEEMQCTNASGHAPIQPISKCVHMKQATKRCLANLRAKCYDVLDRMSCEATFDWCMNELWGPILEAGRNVYDISMECHGDGVDCYWEENAIIALLNSDYIRKLIKTDAQPARFATSSDAVMKDFFAAGEMLISSAPWIAGLLERGVRVLLYAGSYDMACSWLTTDRASLAIEWTGQEVFSEAPMREWEVDGQKAGKVRSSGLLSFASIYGAGHMAPHDKPRESLEMINRWLAEEPL